LRGLVRELDVDDDRGARAAVSRHLELVARIIVAD
jgi:hypothetical protein